MLEIRLLGTFDIQDGKKPVSIASRPAQSLFAYLILNPGTAHRREKLAGMLWPDSLEETARNNLRHSLWRIRKALPARPGAEYLLTDDLSIAFNASADYWLDVSALMKPVENCSADELMASVSEYQGELLPGFYDEWVLVERESLASIFDRHMARLMSLLETEERWLDILDWGERWIKLGQKPEPAYQALMKAHAAKGDMSKVAATYGRCVKSLTEFGIEPSERTRALYTRLKKGEETFDTRPTISIKEKHKVPVLPQANLPIPLTSFIGRQKETDEVIPLLKQKRLLTLTGPGGIGKTRLAIQSANQVLPIFKDGVLWVDLSDLTNPDLLLQTVAQIAGVLEIQNQPLLETLVTHLRFKQTLLILDNCEHLISACAQLIDRLLGACGELKILATSREGLDILGETIWQVPSLSLPDLQVKPGREPVGKSESIQLFVDRARMIQPEFKLTDQNAPLILQICRRLSGMPLAIELAAARIRMMTVDAIAHRLDDRFNLLTGGSRTAMPRQQTLRAAIDWSHEILSVPEQILFRRLSVFAGDFPLEAAEAIATEGPLLKSQVLNLLAQLINKSLVNTVVPAEGSNVETRYSMLETIREYAREKLRMAQEEDSVHNRHLGFFLNMVEEFEPRLERAEQQIWLDRLEAELDNLRVAIDWALASGQTLPALRIVGGLRRFWLLRNHDREGMDRLRAILDHAEARQPTSARLKALNTYFFLLWAHGELIHVQPLIDEALSLGVQLEDGWNTAFTFLYAGISAVEQGDYARARWFLQQSDAEWHDAGDAIYQSMSSMFLGEIAMLQNDLDQAKGLFEAALQHFKPARDYPFLGMVLRRLGQLAIAQGNLSQADIFIREGLVYNWNIRDVRGTCACLAALAEVSVARGQTERAASLMGVVESILSVTQIPLLPFDQREYERNKDRLHIQRDRAIASQLRSQVGSMDLEQAVSLALTDKHP